MSTVRAVVATPLSGPLAGYGRATAAALRLWADRFADPGPVQLDVVDIHPDVHRAVRLAEQRTPDLLFGPYGSGPTATVATATPRVVFNHGGARLGPKDNVVNILAPASSYFRGALEVAHRQVPELRHVCVVHSDTGFGRGVADGAEQTATRLGLGVDRATLPFDPPDADMLLAAGRFEDERALLEHLRPVRWKAVALVSAGVDEVLADRAPDREGLLGPAQWLPATAPRPDEGPHASEFVTAYRARTGDEPPYPAAQAFAAGVIAARCLRDAGAADFAALLAAAHRLDCTTLFGRFRLAPTGHQIGHQVLTVQWQHGHRVVVWPPHQAQAPARLPLSD